MNTDATKTFNDWSNSDRFWFIMDLICIIINVAVLAIFGFNIISILSLILVTVGGTGIYFKNNPEQLGTGK